MFTAPMTKHQNPSKSCDLPDDVVVSLNGVSKKFCKHLRRSMAYGIADLSKNLFGVKPDTAALRKDEFWAVDNVSFELRRGETLGLIGVNGSGKTTLLRLLSGILPPDKGKVIVRGKVGALIAVGAGFHPHMTGLENIYLNGAILGISRDKICDRLEDIISFAEIGDFLDAPVATYSSGMRVRLGFSIAVHMDPDLMLIDEVLAVGDFNFRQKCSEKINDIRRKTAVTFVSHNLRDVLLLCPRTVVMDRGRVVFQGSSHEAIEYYLNVSAAGSEEGGAARSGRKKRQVREAVMSTIYGEVCQNTERIKDVRYQWRDREGNPVETLDHGADIFLEFSFNLLKPVNNLVIGIPIYDTKGILITGISTDMDRIFSGSRGEGCVNGMLKIEKMCFNPGRYVPYMAVTDNNEFIYRNQIGEFSVREKPFFFGIITPSYHWSFKD